MRVVPCVLTLLAVGALPWAEPFTGRLCLTAHAASPEQTSSAPTFSDAQREYIHAWIRQLVPELSREASVPAVVQFLEGLRREHPADFDRLHTSSFPVHRYRSMLLRAVGSNLKGSEFAQLRQAVARERVRALLESEGGAETSAASVSEILSKIETIGSIHLRRLEEGRTEDGELLLLIKRTRETERVSTATTATPARELSAGEIVAEYARRNQEGAALQKLQAITYHSELTTPEGNPVEVFLFKMRPDRFRMVLRQADQTRQIMAFDGRRFWAHGPGRKPQVMSLQAAGALRHLAEFADPLFGETGATFQRLPDREEEGRRLYRIGVVRRDGTNYVAWIDPETFQQVGRETEDKKVIRFSDFRNAGGMTVAFQEESVDAQGKVTGVVLKRVTANPSLIQPFFEPSGDADVSLFELEPQMAKHEGRRSP